MLLSLVVLGETQNLSLAVQILDVSRQTIRRHIRKLEEMTGQTFFEPGMRQYQLTAEGELAIAEARRLVDRSIDWLQGKHTVPFALASTAVEDDADGWLYTQQHSIVDMWSMAPPIITRGAESWMEARGALDSPAFDQVRPYILVQRKFGDEWLIVEVGEKSSYATWLGLSLAKSELGRAVSLGTRFEPMVASRTRPFEIVLANGGMWYEHISANIPRREGGNPAHVNYQRLICAGKFADGLPAIIIFAARTDRIDVPHLPEARNIKNKPEYLMEFDV